MKPAWALAAAPVVLTYSGPGEEDEDDVLPIGSIHTSAIDVDPGLPKPDGFGYGTWERWGAGRFVLGIGAGGTPEALGGAATVTPAGTVSAPTFTGQSAQATNAVSAGTPAGSCSAPTFTGTALSGHAHGPGTLVPSAHAGAAVADHLSHTHTYTQVPPHVHVERAQGGTTASTTGTHLMTSAATGGSLRSAATSTLDPTGASNPGTTNGPGSTMTHNVTQPSAHTMSGSSESVSAGTPAGTNSAPAFTGSALTPHSHTLTPAGTCSAPTFTGQQHSLMPPSITAFLWKRVA